jgi:hypothetical protein
MPGLDHATLTTASWVTIGVAGGIVLLAVALALAGRQWSEGAKKILFSAIISAAIGGTLVLGGITVIETVQSETKGPVHWHADFVIVKCGETLNLVDPTGLSNRIGNPVVHEHGDDRIHVEGTVLDYSQVTLAAFFRVIGGGMTETSLIVPTQEYGLVELQNGEHCAGGDRARLQTFVYQVAADGVLRQTKLTGFEAPNYVLSPETNVPPGDCVVIEFSDQELATTDKLCRFHQIAVEKGELPYEAPSEEPDTD